MTLSELSVLSKSIGCPCHFLCFLAAFGFQELELENGEYRRLLDYLMFCLYGLLSQNCLEILENKMGEYQNSVEGEDFLVEV